MNIVQQDIDRCIRHEITQTKLTELHGHYELTNAFLFRLWDIYRVLGEAVKHDGKLIPTGQASEILISKCKACDLLICLPDSTLLSRLRKSTNMKRNLKSIGLALIALALFTVTGFCADTAAPVAESPQWLLDLAAKHPWIVTVLLVVGTLRLAVKPAFSIWHTYVAATETTKDDEFLEKVETSKWLKWILYALDYVASVKIKK